MRWSAVAILALALGVGVVARAAAVDGKPVLTHDESISYLAATCHQGEYGRLIADGGPPVGRWVPAATWQRFLRPDGRWCPGTIRDDLARWDIHPPAYFWLLHAWTHVAGVGTSTAVGLGVLLDVATLLGLAALARDVTGSAVAAAGVAFAWMLSPAVVPIASEARQYGLIALAAVLLALTTMRLLERGPSPARWLATAAAACLGLLTHYQFAIVVLGAGLWLLPGLRRGRRPAWAGAGALVAGAASAAALAPGFAESVHREQAQADHPMDLLARAAGTARAIGNFVLPGALMPTAIAVLLTLALAVAAGATLRRARLAGDRRALRVLVLLAWIAAGTCGSYLSGRSHGQAMGGKYLAAAWPFAAFVPVLLLRALPARRRMAVAAAGGVALTALGVAAGLTWYSGSPPTPEARIARADGAVVTDTQRGDLPRLALLLPPRMPMLAVDGRLAATRESRRARRARDLISLAVRDGEGARAAVVVRPAG